MAELGYKRHVLRLYSPDEASTVVLESKNAATVFTSGQTLAFANSVTVEYGTVSDPNILTVFDGPSTSYDVGSQLTTNAAAIVTEATNRTNGDADLLGDSESSFGDTVPTIKGVKAGVSTNNTAIASNATNIGNNATNIGNNTTSIGTNATNLTAEVNNRTAAVTAEENARIAADAVLLGATGDVITAVTTIFACKEAIQATNTNVTSNDGDIATNLASINTNTANIASNVTDIATNTTAIDELKSDLATILDGSSIDFDDLSSAVSDYAANNTTTGVLDVLDNLAARCAHLEGVLDELLNGSLNAVTALNDMPINNLPSP